MLVSLVAQREHKVNLSLFLCNVTYPGDAKKWLRILLNVSYSLVVQQLSHVRLFATPWSAAHQASLSFTISWGLLRFLSIELVMLPNHLLLCYPRSPFAFNLSQHQGLFHELALCIRWPKILEFQL